MPHTELDVGIPNVESPSEKKTRCSDSGMSESSFDNLSILEKASEVTLQWLYLLATFYVLLVLSLLVYCAISFSSLYAWIIVAKIFPILCYFVPSWLCYFVSSWLLFYSLVIKLQ